MVLTRLMTAEEFAELRDDGFQHELVRGEVRRMPPPGPAHGRAVARVTRLFFAYEDATGLVLVLTNDTGVTLERDPDTVRGPDISVYLNADLPPEPWTSYFEVVPRAVAEVASPSDRLKDIEEKIDDFRRAGVPLILYCFPETRTVWVDGAGRERTVLTGDDLLDASDVLPGMEPVAIASFFG